MNVLVVEDDFEQFSFVKRTLENVGYRVDECTHGLDAVSFLTAQPTHYGLVMVDTHLPDMAGLELLQEIKAVDGRIQVIVCSAQPEVELLLKAIALQAEGFLCKPISADALCEMVSAVQEKTDRWNALTAQVLAQQVEKGVGATT